MNDWTIFEAIKDNNIVKVKELLDSGVDINATDENEKPFYT